MAKAAILPLESSALALAAFWITYGSWFLFELWISLRDRRAAQGRAIDGGSRLILLLAIYTAIALAIVCGFGVRRAAIRASASALEGAGVSLMWLGMGLRLWAVATLGRFFRTRVFLHDDHALVTSGPYRFLRNPSYAGALLSYAGFGLAVGNWLSLSFAVSLPLAAYIARIRIEERALEARFGPDYAAYRQRSWALIPLIW